MRDRRTQEAHDGRVASPAVRPDRAGHTELSAGRSSGLTMPVWLRLRVSRSLTGPCSAAHLLSQFRGQILQFVHAHHCELVARCGLLPEHVLKGCNPPD